MRARARTTRRPASTQGLRHELAELEQLLQDARAEAAQLSAQLTQAGAAEAAAREEAESAQMLAAAVRGAAAERAAELKVAQDTLRAMREEVNERWVGLKGWCNKDRVCVCASGCIRVCLLVPVYVQCASCTHGLQTTGICAQLLSFKMVKESRFLPTNLCNAPILDIPTQPPTPGQ